MKRLTREERRRIQRRAANIRFLAFVLILLALGVCIGYTAAHAQNACEPPKPQEVSQPSPVDDTPQEPAEQPAEDYSSLDRLELIGTFTATAYCPCVKCCGIWSEDHPSRSEDARRHDPRGGPHHRRRLGCAAQRQRGCNQRSSVYRRGHRQRRQGQPCGYFLREP